IFLSTVGLLNRLSATTASSTLDTRTVGTDDSNGIFAPANRFNQQPVQADHSQSIEQRSPQVQEEEHHDVSPPLISIPPAPRQPGHRVHDHERLPRPENPNAGAGDPVLQQQAPVLAAPATTNNFDGVGNGFTGPQGTFTVNAAPPDTNGDVGPNHYV